MRNRKSEQEILLPEVVQSSEISSAEAQPQPSAPPKPSLPQRWKSFRAALPSIDDSTQKKAGRNIVVFFALMLLLTLVARGTAGATLAVVQASSPASAEIVEAVNGDGIVAAAASNPIEIPAGLAPNEILLSVGQNVKEGDVLARFKPEDVAEQLDRQNIKMKELNLQLKKALQPVLQGENALDNAQTTLNRAQQDYNTNKNSTDSAITAAQDAFNAATVRAQAAADALAALPPDASEEERTAANVSLNEANAVLAEAKIKLDSTYSEADTAMKNAARALEDANRGIDGARKEQQQTGQTTANAVEQNKIDAETTRLEIAKQQKVLDDLNQLQQNKGELKATQGGVATEVAQLGDGASAGEGSSLLARLAQPKNGYQAEVMVNKAEADKLTLGSDAEVTSGSGSMFYTPTTKGKVTAIAPPDEGGRVKVTLALEGTDWKQGQSVQAQIVQKRQSYQETVPVSAIRTGNAGNYVLVLRQKNTILGSEIVLEKMAITVLAQDKNMAAIEGGLGYGDQVLTESSKPVEAGDRVRMGA